MKRKATKNSRATTAAATISPVALSSRDADLYIGKKDGYLKKQRQLGTGPAYVKLGRSVSYLIRTLDRHLDVHVVDVNRDAHA